MVLSHSKRSNAGKAPARLDEAALSISPPFALPKPSKNASSRSREASVASQALRSLKETVLQSTKCLILSIKLQAKQIMQSSIQPASLY
jgi:hypothetical protein